jgi:predicted PurR-regulated permease PerM
MSAPSAPYSHHWLIAAAAFVVVIAGLKAASALLVPFLLAIFIAMISVPLMTALTTRRVPTGVAILVILFLVVAVSVLFGVFAGSQIESFTRALPGYRQAIEGEIALLAGWLNEMGVDVSRSQMLTYLDAGRLMQLTGNLLGELTAILGNFVVILLVLVFLLLEGSGFPAKLRLALTDPENSLKNYRHFARSVNKYLVIKTIMSLATGALVTLWLTILGVDFAILWGVLAFLLNFIPTIGSILAAIPAVLLALVQLGPLGALFVMLGYVAINVGISNLVEPRFLGKHLNLSTLVVFISLVFWGWVFGPVGMLLSIPLTMMIKLALEESEKTRWLAILLSDATAFEGDRQEAS